jgi:predicted MPP superfamily phosphohydrolase
VLFLGVVLAQGYRNAEAAPVIRRLVLRAPNYPTGTPVRIALFSDLHVHGPNMPPERVARIVDRINALHPDIDVVAGDFMGDNWIGARYSLGQAVAPLRGLKAKFGVYAILGNNDSHVRASVRAMNDVGVRVLMNEAVQVGPIALGGLDGRLAHSQPAIAEARRATYAAMERLRGIKVLVAHRPDEFVPAPEFISLVLAGHTHCGQIVLPLIGPLFTGSDFGRQYVCGIFRDGAKTMIVTGGLGTSHLPLRIGAPADIWLITIEGAR